jgi:hypothetical protein
VRAPRAAFGIAGALAAALALLLGAGPAAAVPTPLPKGWWYTELDLARAWRVGQGAGVTVAVIDSGVRPSLGDLRGQVLRGKDFTGAADPGWDDTGVPGDRTFGHGTAMAAFIAGTGRGAGIVGVAPKAKILPIRVGTSATAQDRYVPAAIRWAVTHGADVINMSFGSVKPCPAQEQQAVDDAVRHDVIVVAASGDHPGPVDAPADCTGVIAVGGTQDSQAFRPWPSEGAGPSLDFVAPGDHLVAELLDNTLTTAGGSGTSASAAFVSGTFALLRGRFPHDSARQLVTRALYAVHNGLGGKVFAKRINDRLGYGEILPYYALTTAPPPGARNPIYDAIRRHLAASRPTTSPSSPAPSSASTPAPTSSSAPATSAASTSGGIGAGAVVGIVAAALVVVGLVVAGAMRGRRRV